MSHIWSNAEVKNVALQHFGVQKMMKMTSSSRENTHKISKQFLLFGVIHTGSPCHYYDVKKKKLSSALPLKKCGHTSLWFLYGMILLCDISDLGYVLCPNPST